MRLLPKSETNVRKVKVILSAQLPYVYFSFSLLSLERTYVQKFDTTATEAIIIQMNPIGTQDFTMVKLAIAFEYGSRAASRVDVCEVTEVSTRWLHC